MASYALRSRYSICINSILIVFILISLTVFLYSNPQSYQNVHNHSDEKNTKTFLLYFNEIGDAVVNDSARNKKGYFEISSENSEVQRNRNESEKLLYRKRRYLLFPEGSSFQLVFDLIIPIVDYTNYAIMGITCAVAWELPHKAPSEMLNTLVDRLNDGTLGTTRNDTIDNIQYVDTSKLRQPQGDQMSKIVYIQPTEYIAGNRYDMKFQGKDMNPMSDENRYKPISSSSYDHGIAYYTKPGKRPQFVLKTINNERVNGRRDSLLRSKQRIDFPGEDVRNSNTRPTQHAVYHIMGKRSILSERFLDKQSGAEVQDVWLDQLEKIHLRYHRSTRHALYSKIEAMLYQQKQNGTECILRALCETGKRRNESKPGSLLNEIIRTVFTLPKADSVEIPMQYHYKHHAWDEAHWDHRNCAEIYPQCENLYWN